MIRQAFLAHHAAERPKYVSSSKARLHPSEFGGCKRKVMFRVRGVEGSPFSLTQKEAMRDGIAYENDTLEILQSAFGKTRVATQVVLKNEHWSGKADFVVDHLTPDAVIVEHKATGQKWFDYKSGLPKEAHVLQLAMYYYLYEELFGIRPKLILYYRSWLNWAEFEITVHDSEIIIDGFVNDKPRRRILPKSVTAMMKSYELVYDKNILVKPVAENEKEDAGCTFKGTPSCPFYTRCWNEDGSPKA